jgi:hypothetical protein
LQGRRGVRSLPGRGRNESHAVFQSRNVVSQQSMFVVVPNEFLDARIELTLFSSFKW